MIKKLQVFISSTFTDLREERQAAVEAVLSAGHIPAGMELFNAGNDSQLDTIKRWIRESDVYMLILGGRYGSMENTQNLSYTEIEYRYAVEIGKPVFSIYITDAHLDRKIKLIGKSVFEDKEPKKLDEFKKLVLSRICRPFDDLKDVKIAVHETLNKFSREYTLSGWISGNEVSNYEELAINYTAAKAKLIECEMKLFKIQHAKPPIVYNGNLTYDELTILLKETKLKAISIQQQTLSNLFEAFMYFSSVFNTGLEYKKNPPQSSIAEIINDLYVQSVPDLLTYGLIEKSTGEGMMYKYSTSSSGLNFLAETAKHKLNIPQTESIK